MKKKIVIISFLFGAFIFCCLCFATIGTLAPDVPASETPTFTKTNVPLSETSTSIPTLVRIDSSLLTKMFVPEKTQTSTSTESPLPMIITVDFSVLALTSPIEAGKNAFLKIQGLPNQICSLIYITPAGTISTASGLGDTIGNEQGECSWRWNIGIRTKVGTGKLEITMGGKIYNTEIVIVSP